LDMFPNTKTTKWWKKRLSVERKNLKLTWLYQVSSVFRITTFSSWVRRFANVPQSWWGNGWALCIRLMRFTLKRRKQSIRWEKANFWYWEDLHTQKCVPNWDETALSNRFNAVARPSFLLEVTLCAMRQSPLSVWKKQ